MSREPPGFLSLGEYEARRLRRMEENRRVLQSLDLPTIPRRAKPTPAPKPTKKSEPVRRSRRVQARRQDSAQAEAQPEKWQLQMNRQRELQREQKVARKQGKLQLEKLQRKREQERKRSEKLHEQQFQRALKKYPPKINLPFVYPCQLKNSTEEGKQQNLPSPSLEIELDTFRSRCLGVQLLPKGKRTVIQALCPVGYTTRFSNMSNVHVWQNAIMLFVSEEGNKPYDTMLNSGRDGVYLDWTPQSRWQEISPAMVQRLRQAQKADEELRLNDSYYTSEESSATPVLLFLQHATDPYIYCGRIGYLGHVLDPLKFRWQLMDVASMDWETLYSILRNSSPN